MTACEDGAEDETWAGRDGPGVFWEGDWETATEHIAQVAHKPSVWTSVPARNL
jgi:hypothetical protein